MQARSRNVAGVGCVARAAGEVGRFRGRPGTAGRSSRALPQQCMAGSEQDRPPLGLRLETRWYADEKVSGGGRSLSGWAWMGRRPRPSVTAHDRGLCAGSLSARAKRNGRRADERTAHPTRCTASRPVDCKGPRPAIEPVSCRVCVSAQTQAASGRLRRDRPCQTPYCRYMHLLSCSCPCIVALALRHT